MNNCTRILIIKQTSLGDVLHITAFLREIKKIYPNSIIDIVTDKSALQILENNPHINNFYTLDIYRYERDILKSIPNFFSIIKEFLSHIKEVRKNKYDIAFDLQGLERTIVFLYFCKSREKYAKGKWWFVKHKHYKDVNAIKGYLSFLEFIGHGSTNTKLDFYLPENIKLQFDDRLRDANIKLENKYIVLSPFSRWVTKDISVEKSREIIESVQKVCNLPIIITSTKKELDLCNMIVKDIKNVYALAGTLNIQMLGYLIQNAMGMITVDSFPMHIATSFDIPLIALFGPTSEVRVGPLSPKAYVMRVDNLECARCYKRRDCPNNHMCMENLDANLIAKNLVGMMSSEI